MREMRHNESQEDYLKGIYVVTQRKGYCRSVDLAEELGYSKASVSVAVSKMREENLLRENKKVMDYDWLRERLNPYCCHTNGQPGQTRLST